MKKKYTITINKLIKKNDSKREKRKVKEKKDSI